MFARIKSIKEFEETCLKIDDRYTIDEDDFFKFPLSSKFWNDLVGKRIEVYEAGEYMRQGVKYQLYITKRGALIPYWFFSEHKKRSLEIEKNWYIRLSIS